MEKSSSTAAASELASLATPTAPTALSALQPRPRAVLFDAYGTLFDVYSVALLAEQLFPGQGLALSVLWRDKQIEYTRLVSTSNGGAHYQPFWTLTRAALVFAIKKLAANTYTTSRESSFDSASGSEWARKTDALMNQYRHLSAFPENHAVLRALKAQGIATGILSNGDPDMLGVAVRSAGLDGLLDHVLSVDSVRQYKTHPAAYGLGPQATGLDARHILFVSANAWDALGATWFGYRTLWVNRQSQPFEELGTPPTCTGHNLMDVLTVMGITPTDATY
jgi:2-haloacid dehalogenase